MSYELIETVEVGSGGAASIEFTSIPQDGTDLVVLTSLRSAKVATTGNHYYRFNSDSASNYGWVHLRGNGSSVSAVLDAVDTEINSKPAADTATANTFANASFYISNYASTTTKSISYDNVTENNDTAATQELLGAKYDTSTGISSIEITSTTGDFLQYSTASLYKITAA